MNRKFSFKGFYIILLVIFSLFLGYFYGSNTIHAQWANFKPIVNITSKNPPSGQSLDMSLFYDVLEKVNNAYYDKGKIDPQKLTYGAISGMLQSLGDPYTSFFPPKENTDFKTLMSGEFQGIGAELGTGEDERVIVVAALDGSPARKAGIRAGDAIIKVDGKETFGWTVGEAVGKIRGPKGTQIALTILHEKAKNTVDIKIIRDVITIKSVNGWVKPVECKKDACAAKETSCPTCAHAAYIRLSQFGDKTNNEWVEVVNTLNVEIQKVPNFRGVILDLRNNPGGYLNDAVFIASEFMKSGVVVLQEDGNGERTELKVSRTGTMTEHPVVVLINRGSASASEIVAGALREYSRAKLIGEKSFGKGTIQQAVDVDRGASVHISVAKWLTPRGTWVNEKGLTPDIKVEIKPDEENKDSTQDPQLKRALQELAQ